MQMRETLNQNPCRKGEYTGRHRSLHRHQGGQIGTTSRERRTKRTTRRALQLSTQTWLIRWRLANWGVKAWGVTMGLRDVVDQFHDKHSLADAGTSEQANLATALVGSQKVHHLGQTSAKR
jgi:hypothetical protein